MVYETTSSRVDVFSASHYLEKERRNPAAWTCNKSAVTTTPAAAYPLRPIRYGTTSIPSIHHPTDRPTNQQRPRDVQKRIHQIRHHHHHHHPHSHHTENHCKIHQLHQYLPAVFSVRHETYLTFLGSHPKRKHSSLNPSIHPSIREDRSRHHQLTISKSSEILLYSPKALVTTLGS